ncbi:hypothetical protein R3P38DRAFT_1203027 [Favolaschia claudopus]|uniref:DUF6534 domain-containing protein n=1 Tax=Favolaschia claudopus TaxID=2862362 RepID=A0AAW0B2S9_9AGAR
MGPTSPLNPANIGAIQIASPVSFLLFGILTSQTYTYFTRFPTDFRAIKFLVAFLWINEATHAGCIAHALYTYTILDYGSPELLSAATPDSLYASLLIGIFIVVCVQGFFQFRIHALYNKPYLPIVSGMMSIGSLTAGLVLFIHTVPAASRKLSLQNEIDKEFKDFFTLFWAVTTTNDLTITAVLLFFFIKRRSDVHHRTKPLVDKLIAATIETGFMTCVVATAGFGCFITDVADFKWVALGVIHPHLYSISVVTSLNSRMTLCAMNDGTFEVFSTQTNLIRVLNEPLPADTVQITISKFVVSDAGDPEGDAETRKTAREYENAA